MDAPEDLGPTWISRLVQVLQPLSVRADRLAATPLFAGLERAELERAAGQFEEAILERGARLTVQGKPPSSFWLILEGQALVSADARPIRVARHGDLVGLASLARSAASPETTIALSPIRAFAADRNQLRSLMAQRPVRARLRSLM